MGLEKTVFIIGAGAHKPYGMPVGTELSQTIKLLLYRDQASKINYHLSTRQLKSLKERILINLKGRIGLEFGGMKTRPFFENFIIAFAESGLSSIDRYIATLDEHSEKDEIYIGKFLIYELIKYYQFHEHYQAPLAFRSFDWIEYIIDNFMNTSKKIDSFLENPPIFYTFNYDIILTERLLACIKSVKRCDIEIARDLLKKVKIEHIYGKITKVYTETEDITSLKIIRDKRDAYVDKLSKQIANDITKSKRTYILGFGFEEVNTNVIFQNLSGAQDFDRIFATKFNLPRRTEEKTYSSFPGSVSIFSNLKGLGFSNEMDSLDLISNVVPIL